MIPNSGLRVVQSSGVQAEGNFGISLRNQAHIMEILRSTLYTDKILAILREYSSNAWDAHRSIGKADLPIQVTLPTYENPTLSIRDFGPGMSQEDVFTIYTQYGESTKRGSDTCVGMLGIGSKSGFAYSDSFSVVSFHGGYKKVYVAVLDASNMGKISLLHEEPCGEETGVEIQIPVKPHDIYQFDYRAKNLFSYFIPQPRINTDIPALPPRKSAGYIQSGNSGTWIAVMGCVPYRINIDQLQGDNNVCLEVLRNSSGCLYFDIGDVEVSANREELKYSDQTKKALATMFQLLVEEYVSETLKALEDESVSYFKRRIVAQDQSFLLKAIMPTTIKWFLAKTVELYDSPPKTFRVLSRDNDAQPQKFQISGNTQLVLADDIRPITGFRDLGDFDIVIKPVKGITLDAVKVELDQLLEQKKLTGIPSILLSSFTWSPTHNNWRFKGSEPNKKHLVRTFVLKTATGFGHPYSEGWDIIDREPANDDIYVVMSAFRIGGGVSFYEDYRKDKMYAARLGADMPPVYGYKTTEKEPVVTANLKGTAYYTWRKAFFQSLLTPDRKADIENIRWSEHLARWERSMLLSRGKPILSTLGAKLGVDHKVTRIMSTLYNAVSKTGCSAAQVEALSHATAIADLGATYDVNKAMADFAAAYPLLANLGGTTQLLEDRLNLWADYVLLVDRDHQALAGSSMDVDKDETENKEDGR